MCHTLNNKISEKNKGSNDGLEFHKNKTMSEEFGSNLTTFHQHQATNAKANIWVSLSVKTEPNAWRKVLRLAFVVHVG